MLRSGLNGPQAGRSLAALSHVTGILPCHLVKIQGYWRQLHCGVSSRLAAHHAQALLVQTITPHLGISIVSLCTFRAKTYTWLSNQRTNKFR
jgi:hypothetical protein